MASLPNGLLTPPAVDEAWPAPKLKTELADDAGGLPNKLEMVDAGGAALVPNTPPCSEALLEGFCAKKLLVVLVVLLVFPLVVVGPKLNEGGLDIFQIALEIYLHIAELLLAFLIPVGIELVYAHYSKTMWNVDQSLKRQAHK